MQPFKAWVGLSVTCFLSTNATGDCLTVLQPPEFLCNWYAGYVTHRLQLCITRIKTSVDLQLVSCALYDNRLNGSLPSSWSSMAQVCTPGQQYLHLTKHTLPSSCTNSTQASIIITLTRNAATPLRSYIHVALICVYLLCI